jgi:hypothetical protein
MVILQEILPLMLHLGLFANNKLFSKKLHYQLFKVFFRVIMELFLHMDKLELVKHIQWKEVNKYNSSKV